MAHCNSKKGYKDGGPVSRGGPAKIKNKRREEMNEGIEAAVSEAMSPPDTRSFREKMEDKAINFGRKYQDKMSEFRLTGDVQKYRMGGEVRRGDVRDNAKRGKCY